MRFNKISLLIVLAAAVAGCQAGAQTKASMKNSSDSLQNTITTDNSKKELTTTISPQIAKTIQNYQSAIQTTQGEERSFDPKKVFIVANESFLSPNGTFPSTKNVVRITKYTVGAPLVFKIMNGNTGEGASLENASVAIISPTFRLSGRNGEVNDSWINMQGIHPTDISQVSPSSFDIPFAVLNDTGSYQASFHLVSKDKSEIIRDFTVILE